MAIAIAIARRARGWSVVVEEESERALLQIGPWRGKVPSVRLIASQIQLAIPGLRAAFGRRPSDARSPRHPARSRLPVVPAATLFFLRAAA